MGWMWDTYEDISGAIGRALEPGYSTEIHTEPVNHTLSRWDMEEAFDTALMLNRGIPYSYPSQTHSQGNPNLPIELSPIYIQFQSLGKGPKHGVKRIWRESTHWRLMRLGYKTWTDERGRKWVDYDTISKEIKVYDCDGKEVVNG